MSSRLFTEVRERRGLAYYIYGFNQGYTDTGTLFAQGGVDIKRIDDAVATIVGEFGRIASEPIEADELEKARNFAKGRLVLSLEDPKGMISFGLRDEVLEGKVREPDEVLAALDRVTLDDVSRVAQDVIRDDRLNLALVGPFDDPERFEKLLALSA
jgi:predicted Zn-dependent peptidase